MEWKMTKTKKHVSHVAFTMADRLARTSRECRTKCKLVFCELSKTSRFHNGLVGLRSAFTMAEILLSLTIIGVVAAITLPSLTGNINERWGWQGMAPEFLCGQPRPRTAVLSLRCALRKTIKSWFKRNVQYGCRSAVVVWNFNFIKSHVSE